jgi:Na+/proline symporter
MPLSLIDILVVIIYLLAVLGLGIYQALKIRSSGDYYAGGRKFNKFYLMMHWLGTASHADEPVSVIGGAYQKGLSGIWYTYMYLPLTPIFWLIAPYVRRTRFVTMADFFRARYDRSLAVMYSIVGVLKMSVAIGVVLKGTATIVTSVVNAPPEAHVEFNSMLAMTVVFVSYGFAGGLRATIVTETIQGPLIAAMSMLLLPFGVWAAGGFRAMHEALANRPGFFGLSASGYEFTPRWVIASSLTALIGWVAQPGLVAAIGSGKTELEGRVGCTYGTMIKRFCAMGWVFTGIALAALVAQNKLPADQVQRLQRRELAFGIAIEHVFPRGMLGLTLAAILAAQMATLSAQMVNSSALAAHNLFKAVIKPDATDRQVLIFGRVCGIFLVAIGVYLASSLGKVADALTMLLQFTAITGVIVWAGVLWRRANSAGAWAGLIILFVAWVVFGPVGELIRRGVGGPAWLGRYGPAEYMFELTVRYLPAGLAALIIVSLLTKPQPRKQLDDFFMLLKTPVGEEQKLIDANVPVVYVGNATPNPLELKHPHLVHWGGFLMAAMICVLVLGLLWLLAHIGA